MTQRLAQLTIRPRVQRCARATCAVTYTSAFQDYLENILFDQDSIYEEFMDVKYLNHKARML